MTRRRLLTNHSWLAMGPGSLVDLVLVVVHQHNAVGVGGNLLQVVVVDRGRGIDVEAQIARMQVGVELLDEAQVIRVGVVGQAFNVQREAAIDRERQ